MDVAAIVSSVNVLGLICFGYLVKGLKQRIENLTLLAKEQKETLEAARTRAAELDQLRKDYRQGLTDYQDLGNKLNELRAEVVQELEQAVKSRDEKLAQTKQRELESLDRIPQLEVQLTETIAELKQQVALVSSASARPTRLLIAPRRLSPRSGPVAFFHDDTWLNASQPTNADLWHDGYLARLQSIVCRELAPIIPVDPIDLTPEAKPITDKEPDEVKSPPEEG
jgi:hypothetical protein